MLSRCGRDVIHTFNAKGLAALDPRWAGGRPRLISHGDIEVIVTAARTRPEKLGQPFTCWSLRKLAGYLAGLGRPVRIGRERLRGITREHKGADHTLAALRSIRAARPDGYRLFVIMDDLAAKRSPPQRTPATLGPPGT